MRVKIVVADDVSTVMKANHVLKIDAKPKDTKTAKDSWASLGEYPVLVSVYDALDEPASLELKKLELIRPGSEQNPTAFVMRVKNIGGKIGRISGKISVSRRNRKEIGHLDIGLAQPELILPGKEREFRAAMPTLDQGEFKLLASIDLDRKGNEVLHEEIIFSATGVELNKD